MQLRRLAPLTLLLAPLACDSDPLAGPGPEVLDNGTAAVDERAIRAALDEGAATVSIPLARKGRGAIAGRFVVRVIDVADPDEPRLGSATLDFEQDADLATHTVRVDGLPAGLERAETSALVVDWSATTNGRVLRGQRSLYAALGRLEVQIRGASEVPEDGAAPIRVLVRDPDTLAPIGGAAVRGVLEVEGAEPEAAFEAETGAHGEVVEAVELPSGVDAATLRLDVRHDGAHAWYAAPVRRVEERRLSLSTDKTIYKPGQSVSLRTLALNPRTQAPLASEAVVFEALDGKGNKVFERSVEADAFGVAATEVPLDQRVNEGEWTFRAEIDGARVEKKLPVERYNLPKIVVDVAPEASFALPGDTVRGQVEARYVFGRPAARSDVTVIAKVDGQEVGRRTGALDDAGAFAFALDVPRGLSGAALEDGALSLALEAEVVDPAEQREVGQASLPLAAAPLVLRVIPASSHLHPGVENTVFVTVTDPVGRPLVADLTADLDGRTVTRATGPDGVAELSFLARADENEALLRVAAVDGADRTHARTVTLSAGGERRLLVRTDRAVYRAGDTAQVEILAPVSEGRAYVDVYAGDLGAASQAVQIRDQVGRVEIPVTEAMRGAILVDAFLLGAQGEVVRGAARALVDPENRLRVTMASAREQLTPGEPMTIALQVQDAEGQPRVASVGLSVVDQAVFALGGEPQGDLRSRFLLDPSILPADLRALGRGPLDLFDPEVQGRDRVARLMFASAPTPGAPGLDHNSVRAEMPAVKAALEGTVRRDAVTMLADVARTVQSEGVDEDRVPRYVRERARRLVDPFGQRYRVEDDHEWQLRLTSAGPDERFGSLDDVSATVWFHWVLWADSEEVARGGWDDDAAFEGGANNGAPPPQAEPGADPTTGGEPPAAGGEVRVRQDFRETIYVNPTLVTDASGRAEITFPLADSITTWRATGEASTAEGHLGTGRFTFATFQEFFLDFSVPTALTAGDEIELRAVVYNYLPTAQTVTVTLEDAPGIDLVSPGTRAVDLGPSEVRAVTFTVRFAEAGTHALTLRGLAGGIGDALVRTARVKPDGVPEDETFSDALNGRVTHTVTVPADTVPGGAEVVLTLTPGFASEAVQGTERMLQEPNGCFEQTTSAAWPNTMVVQYLDTTGQLTPELEARGFDLVTRGYQRLLTFESPTGGFNWWGDADPGNRVLSAIFLWHLKDLERLIETDDAVRDRTLSWLIDQQRPDGAWDAGDALHSGNEVLGENEIRSTAFIAWALAHTGWADEAVERAAGYLRSHRAEATDLYTQALAANALALADPGGAATQALLSSLDDQKQVVDGRVKWPTEAPSWTGAGGDTAAIETTGLVAYGLMNARAYPENASGALRFLVANKDAVGTWYNTQATMNALRALLAAASPTGSEAEGTFTITVNGQALPPIAVTPETGDVYRSVDLTPYVRTGDNRVELDMQGTGELTYSLNRRAYRPGEAAPPAGPFDLAVTHDVTEPAVGDTVTTDVVATYLGDGQRDQVMLRIGRAPGMAPRTDDLDRLVEQGVVSRYEVRETDVTFYLMGVQGNAPRALTYRSTATLALDAEAPASSIYAYYEPTLRTEAPPVRFVVRGE